MTRYLVTRHDATADWFRRHGPDGARAQIRAEADARFLAGLRRGDVVYGNLPAPLVADISARGAQYTHLSFDPAPRDRELTLAQIEANPPRLVPVTAARVGQAAAGRPVGPPLRPFLMLFASVTILGAGLSLFYDAAVWFFERGAPVYLALSAAGLAVAALTAYVLWRVRGRLLQFSVRRVPRSEPRRALILGLSVLRGEAAAVQQAMCAVGLEALADSASRYRHRIEIAEPEEAEVLRQAQCPWQQAVRAVHAHLPDLAVVVVLASRGPVGSSEHVAPFSAMLTQIAAQAGHTLLVVEAPGSPTDYEDQDAVRAALTGAVGFLRRRHGIDAGQIAVDITAGTKIFSVAAAALTLNTAMRFLYVDNDGVVNAYEGRAGFGELE